MYVSVVQIAECVQHMLEEKEGEKERESEKERERERERNIGLMQSHTVG